jgi:hypothetical protein
MSGIAKKMLQAAAGAQKGPSEIGEPYGGGFYAGKIDDGGTEYYLIVAPKSSGELADQYWKTSLSSTPGTSSVIDGPTNSSNMNNANHPAAQFCEGLSINGYTDWYLPAKNELEVCYYNLKPTTDTNHTPSGINANAVPPRLSSYTSGDPAQTSVTDFQSGGTEAFASQVYWTSTEYSSLNAWVQYFGGLNDYSGQQFDDNKLSRYYARAIRRELV